MKFEVLKIFKMYLQQIFTTKSFLSTSLINMGGIVGPEVAST